MDYNITTGDGQKRLMAESVGLDSETYIAKDASFTGLKIGDDVTYKDINLYWYRGKILSLDGKFCQVEWTYPNLCTAKEWTANLRIAITVKP